MAKAIISYSALRSAIAMAMWPCPLLGLPLLAHLFWVNGADWTTTCDVGYDENVKPSIANSFATAAMRFGHTQIQGMFHGRDAGYNVISNIALSTV